MPTPHEIIADLADSFASAGEGYGRLAHALRDVGDAGRDLIVARLDPELRAAAARIRALRTAADLDALIAAGRAAAEEN